MGNQKLTLNQMLEKVKSGQALSAQMLYNTIKASEYGDASLTSQPGVTSTPSTELATASTALETNASPKVCYGKFYIGSNLAVGALDRVRMDASDQTITTNQGVPVADKPKFTQDRSPRTNSDGRFYSARENYPL